MFQKITVPVLLSIMLMAASIPGCGGGDSPITPYDPVQLSSAPDGSGGTGHILWGLYDIAIDTNTLEVEIVPLRTAEFTANVTGFMQPPSSPIHLLSIVLDPIASDIPNGLVVCDVTLKHPFPGMNKFRGFDVRGICMGDESMSLMHDSSASYGGPGDLTLLNADGYARWWNPQEFGPEGKIFGYIEGSLAPPGYTPDAILNGYKYFADELGTDEDLVLDPFKRGTFSTYPGSNTRR